MSIKEREELLFQKLREKDPDIVADGVICEQEFLNARYKIVYILKEVNGGKSWDLRDFVYEGGRPQTWDAFIYQFSCKAEFMEDEQIGELYYIENGEVYFDENDILRRELFEEGKDLFI